MPAVFDCAKRVCNAGGRIAGCVDHDVDSVGSNQRHRVVGHMGSTGLAGRVEAGDRGVVASNARAGGVRAVGIQVGKGHYVDARGTGCLGQVHGAELAGADQPDADRVTGLGTGEEHSVQVHMDTVPVGKSVHHGAPVRRRRSGPAQDNTNRKACRVWLPIRSGRYRNLPGSSGKFVLLRGSSLNGPT